MWFLKFPSILIFDFHFEGSNPKIYYFDTKNDNQIDDLISRQTCLFKLLILEWKLGHNGGVLLHGLDVNGCVVILIEDLIEDVHPLPGQYVTVLIPKITSHQNQYISCLDTVESLFVGKLCLWPLCVTLANEFTSPQTYIF